MCNIKIVKQIFMGIGDKIIKWWVQNFYATKMIKYEPGFIVTEFSNKYGSAYQRLVSLSEDIIIEIENKILEKYGSEGENLLRVIGQTYGFNFAYLFNAPTLTSKGKEFVSNYVQFAANYGFLTWARKAEISDFDLEKVRFEYHFEDHVVCRKNGKGVLLTESVVAGTLVYVMGLPIKTEYSTCQGRGDKDCTIIYSKGDINKTEQIYDKLLL